VFSTTINHPTYEAANESCTRGHLAVPCSEEKLDQLKTLMILHNERNKSSINYLLGSYNIS
jgi:hypothetical protein